MSPWSPRKGGAVVGSEKAGFLPIPLGSHFRYPSSPRLRRNQLWRASRAGFYRFSEMTVSYLAWGLELSYKAESQQMLVWLVIRSAFSAGS